jgi:carbon-monoxide dehydrogenase medium subunit
MNLVHPTSVAEAVAALRAGDGRCLAGGQSLVAMMNAGLVAPDLLVSLRDVADLARVTQTADGGLELGAMTTHDRVAALPPTSGPAEVVIRAAGVVGYPAVRNRGTIGGAVAHADPAADEPTALVAADAMILVDGPAGARAIPAEAFFTGYFETAAAPGEIVTAVRLPAGPSGAVGHYEKFAIVAGDYAVASVAVVLAVRDGRCGYARVAVGACGSRPIRVAAADALLIGNPWSADAVAEAGRLLADACDPIDDHRGGAAYRRRLVPRLARRAIEAAWVRAEASLG